MIQEIATEEFQGTLKVRTTKLTLTGKDEFVGAESSGEIRDADGKIVAISCATIRGERITVEPQLPQCIEPPR